MCSAHAKPEMKKIVRTFLNLLGLAVWVGISFAILMIFVPALISAASTILVLLGIALGFSTLLLNGCLVWYGMQVLRNKSNNTTEEVIS